jgi:hypothetical protein
MIKVNTASLSMLRNRSTAKYLLKHLLERVRYRNDRVHMINFWEVPPETLWLYRFVKSRNLLDAQPNIQISFFSVFGPIEAIEFGPADVKIFYTGENVLNPFYEKYYGQYRDYGFSRGIDLALGFEYLQKDNYHRFPNWLTHFVSPDASFEDVKAVVDSCNECEHRVRPHFASLVARHDAGGLRKSILDEFTKIDLVHCAGSWNKNTDLLSADYKDDKNKFLGEFKFNICPENSDAPGYVTEKVFQAILSGCIPVYSGSGNNPEPEILNKNAIIFFDKDGDNKDAIRLVREIHNSPALYRDFKAQKPFQAKAADAIYTCIETLEKKLRERINSSK